jgi:hypothetical protein
VDCQSEGFAECELDVQGGCELACESEDGALFCDGQYVDHGDNLQRCIDALEAVLDLEVETHAEAQCSDGRCEARASATISSGGPCAVTHPGRAAAPSAGLFCVVGLFGIATLRTRRRRRT